jgi:hypothetical protein
MSFIAECAYQPTAYGLIFLPPDCEANHPCELQVDIAVTDYCPAEPGVGAGPSFGWEIERVWIIDMRWGYDVWDKPMRPLDDAADARARRFIETYYGDELAERAIYEAAELYGVSHQVAA